MMIKSLSSGVLEVFRRKPRVIPMNSSRLISGFDDPSWLLWGFPCHKPWQGMVYTTEMVIKMGWFMASNPTWSPFSKLICPSCPSCPSCPRSRLKNLGIWAGERFVPAVLASTSSVCPRFLRLRNIATDEMSNLCFFFTSQDDYEMRWKIRPWWLMSAIFQWLCSKPAMPLQFLSQD